MPTLWKELKKIIGQIRGSQNIFGYKSTVANQMFLFYCFCGNIYFTDKMDVGIKYLWYILVFVELATSYILTLIYFLYAEEYDVIMMLLGANVVGTSNVATFGFPLISYICADQIEAMIELADHILPSDVVDQQGDLVQNRIGLDVRNIFISFIRPFLVCCVIYLFICFFDVILFFSEDKVKNDFYYMSPIPLIKEHGTFGSFIFFNGISTYVFGMFLFKLISVFAIVLYWSTICCNELTNARNELDNRSRNLVEDMEGGARVDGNFNKWNLNFQGMIQHNIGKFQEIILLINHMRMFVEVIGSFITPLAFFYGIAVLYICLSEELLFVLILKYVAGTLGCTFSAFVFYWVGQNLENSIIDVSSTVYSTPWYDSVKVRKNMHIFLCQTQTVKNFAMIKVYGLLLKNFSRYLHGVMSYTNLLRRLTLK